ncbi:helix-turn-helix domain-containing protein [Saccharopolyspora sp. NPDC003752]
MDVHVRDLRYFVAVAEELNFTRAAARLFIAQPSLSKQIRQLETSLRVTLFERDHRTVALTAAGAALLPQSCAAPSKGSRQANSPLSGARGTIDAPCASSSTRASGASAASNAPGRPPGNGPSGSPSSCTANSWAQCGST